MRPLFTILIASFITGCTLCTKPATSKTEQEKIDRILCTNHKYAFGLDVSHYQGAINWKEFGHIKDSIPVSFIFIRATMGNNGRDTQFPDNWQGAKDNGITRGAYHFYRPNENSIEQAENFIKHVNLMPGDLPPVLDIETLPDPQVQSVSSLIVGLKRFLNALEEQYGVLPIIYTSDNYFNAHLAGEGFEDYPLWIANYNNITQPKNSNWSVWQFTDQATVPGINEFVDVNVFKGKPRQLQRLVIQ